MSDNNFPINQFFNSNIITKNILNLNKENNDNNDNSLANMPELLSKFNKREPQKTIQTNLNQSLNNTIQEINQLLFTNIKSAIGDEKFNTIFSDSKVTEITLDTTTITTISLIQKLFISENYSGLLLEELKNLNINTRNIKIVIKNSSKNLQMKLESTVKSKNNKFSFKLNKSQTTNVNKTNFENNLKPSFNSEFNNIISSSFNKLALTSLMNVTKQPGKQGKYPFIYLYGDSGIGKSQILHATKNEIIHNFPNLRVLSIGIGTFIKDIINSYRNNNLESFNQKYNDQIDVLIIDDIQDLKNKEGSLTRFNSLFNDLFCKGKQIIICGDKNPKSLEGFSDKLKSRLQWGVIVKINKPDFDSRVKILKEKANKNDLFLNDEVINFLAGYFNNSIRELEGAILSLSAYTEIMNTEIDLELAKEQLSITQTQKIITIDDIADKTCEHFNLSKKDLFSKSKKKTIVTARHIAWYLTREILNMTYIDIARYYSKKEHTTVIYAFNKINTNLKNDANLSKTIFLIKSSL